jgi:hypothetical protein
MGMHYVCVYMWGGVRVFVAYGVLQGDCITPRRGNPNPKPDLPLTLALTPSPTPTRLHTNQHPAAHEQLEAQRLLQAHIC